jgi:transcriptional regulator with XRE-family HTH domain
MQIHRDEAGASQPTLDVIRRLAVTLGVTADELVFGPEGRGPDQHLKLRFEAVSQFGREDKNAAKALLDALILKAHAKRWTGTG